MLLFLVSPAMMQQQAIPNLVKTPNQSTEGSTCSFVSIYRQTDCILLVVMGE